MPWTPLVKLSVGDIITDEGKGIVEGRIRTIDDLDANGERIATFFDYPGEVRLDERVMRTGHQPLSKREQAAEEATRVPSGDVGTPPEQPKSAPSGGNSSETHVEPGESVPPEVVTPPRNTSPVIQPIPVVPRIDVAPDVSLLPIEEGPLPRPKAPVVRQRRLTPRVDRPSSRTGADSPVSNWNFVDDVVPAQPELSTSSGSTGGSTKETEKPDLTERELESRILEVTTASDKLSVTFYGISALCAVVGSSMGIVSKVPSWPEWIPEYAQYAASVVPVTVIELGGVVSAALGDVRRQKGESAYGYRILSATVAGAAVLWQLWSHDFEWYAWLFAGFTSFAYMLYLLSSGARRRDALRLRKQMLNVTPQYPLWMQIRHPQVVRLAKSLALSNDLGIIESLAAAREELSTQKRRETIARALERAIKKAYKDSDAANIALATYDLEKLAAKIEGNADYEGWAEVISTNLAPRKVTTERAPRSTAPRVTEDAAPAPRQRRRKSPAEEEN
jgi:hypothetical protein